MRSYYRQKTIYCGDRYREIDIFPYTPQQDRATKRKRKKRRKETPPGKERLNDKTARRYFTQLANMNFDPSGYHVTLTYRPATLPQTIEQAERAIANYIRRVQYRRRRDKLPDLRYILISSYGIDRKGKLHRIHHHIIMDGALDRQTVKNLWKSGRVNADELEPDENGIAGLCTYLTKHTGGKKRWSSSHNLKRPSNSANDTRYNRRKVERICNEPLDIAFWEKQYPGWTLTDPDNGIERVYNEITGWSISLKLRRKE